MAEAKQRKNRGHGEGAIQKRSDGRWMAQLMVGNWGYKAGRRSCVGRLLVSNDAALGYRQQPSREEVIPEHQRHQGDLHAYGPISIGEAL